MTVVVDIFRYGFPLLVVSIAVVLLCFYLKAKKKRASYDVGTAARDGAASPACRTISLPEDEAEGDTRYDRFPPRYSTMDLPPPYSLFDPKLTAVWPGGPPPAYEMYPITLPLAPHYWSTSAASQQPTPPSSPTNRSNPHPERSHGASSG